MPDKMMRVAGRGDDGTAKAIKTDNDGRIITKDDAIKRPLFETSQNLESGALIKTPIIESKGRLYGRLSLSLGIDTRKIKVSLINIEETTERTPITIFEGFTENYHLNVDYTVMASRFILQIENLSTGSLYIQGSSFNTLHNNGLKNKEDSYKKPLFSNTDFLESGELLKSDAIKSKGYLYGRLSLSLDYFHRDIKVSLINLEQTTERDPVTIYEGVTTSYHLNVDYAIMADRYIVQIENKGTSRLLVQRSSFNVLHNNPHLNTSKIETQMDEINQTLKKQGATGGSGSDKTKQPGEPLSFKQSPLDIATATKGYDESYYVIDNLGVIKKYEDIKVDSEPVETGVNVYDDLNLLAQDAPHDRVTYLNVTEKGITYFVTIDNTARIYYAETINELPTSVYQSNAGGQWSSSFGVKSYVNGIDSIIFCGVYGKDDAPLDLLLSTNGGQTFEKVGETRFEVDGQNHWHDVEIDVYSGYLYTSQGDRPGNRSIHYSTDFGQTWENMSNTLQPTSITAFPDRVVFGRDSLNVGLDYVLKPEKQSIPFEQPEELIEFKDEVAYPHFARSSMHLGNEAYIGFTLYNDAENPIVVATGDGGRTWHNVYYGKTNVGNFFHIDEDYIYGYNRNYDGVIFAKKPVWK